MEVFKYMSLAYDVTKAKALVDGREAQANIDPKQWENWISREIPCSGPTKRMLTLGIGINQEHVASVDTDQPVIVARFTMPGEDVIPLPIDGWHRIQKAINEGLEEIPAHYLTLEESEEVRIR